MGHDEKTETGHLTFDLKHFGYLGHKLYCLKKKKRLYYITGESD